MLRMIQRRLAIRSYVRILAQELLRRFGMKPCYTIDQVNKAAEKSRVNRKFIIYAHAMFCGGEEFNQHHDRSHRGLTYNATRLVVLKRYFNGRLAVDAADIIRATRPRRDDVNIHETGAGEDVH